MNASTDTILSQHFDHFENANEDDSTLCANIMSISERLDNKAIKREVVATTTELLAKHTARFSRNPCTVNFLMLETVMRAHQHLIKNC